MLALLFYNYEKQEKRTSKRPNGHLLRPSDRGDDVPCFSFCLHCDTS